MKLTSYKRFPILLVIAFLASLLYMLPAHAADPLDTIERAMGLLESGKIEAARATLATSPDYTDPNALLHTARGVVDLVAGRVDSAELYFRAALDQEPNQVTALWGLALCLLQRHHAFEAASLVDRAAVLAPDNTRVKALQAYIYQLLGRVSDAAAAGKAALDGGNTSPFLMATLAQIHRQMGYAQKAIEFGSFAAKSCYGKNFLTQDYQVSLPLTMIITDTPQALAPSATKPAPRSIQRTNLEIEVPKVVAQETVQRALEITAPQPGATLRGVQQIQAVYHGISEIKFVVFLVDDVMRGMLTELPYHFQWDADTATPGEHELCVRTYDIRGIISNETRITVTTTSGQQAASPEFATRVTALEQRMQGIAMPTPKALSLFTNLGWWYLDTGNSGQAITCLEKAAALDPTTEGVLDALSKLYHERGMHSISDDGEVYHGPTTGKKRVALTFDDGPNPLYTPSILSELKKYNARSTFFLVGKMAQQYPDQVLDILANGHELANHSYTHPNMTTLSQNEIIAEVLRTRTVIKDITGQTTYFFRPPGGNIDPFVTKQLRALDYNIIYWSLNAGEYRKNTPTEQVAQMMARVYDGSILLMHNGPVDGTLNILPMLLAELHKRGYTCVTVSDLMDAK